VPSTLSGDCPSPTVWYFYKHGGPSRERDAGKHRSRRRQWRGLGLRRALGCIVYPATEIEAPGVIRHVYGNQFSAGEPSGEITPDVQRLADLFVAAGMKAPVLDRIRDEIWLKLWAMSASTRSRADACDARHDLHRSRHARAVRARSCWRRKPSPRPSA